MEFRINITKEKLILWIVLLALLTSVIILLFTVFSSKSVKDIQYKKEISALDSVIKYKDVLIKEKEIRLLEKDSAITEAWSIIKYKDSLIEISISNEKKHTNNYRQVPTTVRNLDKDALRRAVREFQNQ